MALTLRYFNDFAKPAFRLITASSSIELIDQNSASVTHRAGKLVYVLNSRIYGWTEFHRYLLVIYGVSFTLALSWFIFASGLQ